MKALLICLDTGRTIETNSDLHLWLQNSMVDCIEFIDFKFDYELLIHLTNMDPKLFRLNYAVFDYRRKASEEPISAQHISYLFSIKAFEVIIISRIFGPKFHLDMYWSGFFVRKSLCYVPSSDF